MIKLFTPESFKDYIHTVESMSGVIEGFITDTLVEPTVIQEYDSLGLSQILDGDIVELNGYFEEQLSGEVDSLIDAGEAQGDAVSIIDDSHNTFVDDGNGSFEDEGEIIDPMDLRPDLFGNGDIILHPTACTVEVELNGSWKLNMTHPFDREGRYTYICKDAVIVVPVKVAREQNATEQAFRVFQVKYTQNGVEVVAYPVIYESIYETPIDYLELENVTAEEFRLKIQTWVTGKYGIRYLEDLGSNKESIYIENSNLQETINGNQEGTITSLYDCEVIYDNYDYLLKKKVGDQDAYKDHVLKFAKNITSIAVTETMDEMITRIFPMSSEGVTVPNHYHVDSTNIDKYPFAYAKSIKYDDIKLVDEKDEDDKTPETAMQVATREVKAAITAKVNELSLKYLKRARAGQWDDTTIYEDYTIYNRHNPERGYSYVETRRQLPYGYLFYSYTDAIGVLTERVLNDLITVEEEKELYSDAIKDGFKWCETTEIAGYDWRMNVTYNDQNYEFFQTYTWLQDENGWWYGDGNHHYMTNAWIEADTNTHYWVGADGYWQPEWDDHSTWYWFQNDSGWWYGNKNPDGSTKNYAREQYIYVTENANTYWFNGDGYFVDGDNKTWSYGSKDKEDIVKNQYWTVGSETWWFNEYGEISNTLAYAPKFDWRTDEHGKYYGDGQGHWLSNCWVEDGDSKHRWIDEDGYYYGVDDESSLLGRYDGQQWIWHGNWEQGWWYGDNYEDANNSSPSGSQETGTGTGSESGTSLDIGQLGSNLLPEYANNDAIIGKIFESSTETSKTETSSLQKMLSQGYIYIKNNKAVGKLKKKITGLNELPAGLITNLQDMGYVMNQDQTALELPDTTTSPSGEDLDPEEKTGLKNYVWGQFMYVSSYNKWYWFDTEGYYVDCWLATDNWEWHNDSLGWWYGDGAGTYPQGQWMKIGGKWYFFDERGYADSSTDDFNDPKNGTYESATYDSNREGIKVSGTKSKDEEVVYDDTREGVRAWIQDDFVDELMTTIIEQSNYLHEQLKKTLTDAAKKDLAEYDHPKYTVSVNFVTLANSPEYAKFAFLKDMYLGDTITINYLVTGIYSTDRITAITYDCLKKDITAITIGDPVKTFIRKMAELTPKGTLKKWKPVDGLEDGYGGYLLTGFAGTNLTV